MPSPFPNATYSEGRNCHIHVEIRKPDIVGWRAERTTNIRSPIVSKDGRIRGKREVQGVENVTAMIVDEMNSFGENMQLQGHSSRRIISHMAKKRDRLRRGRFGRTEPVGRQRACQLSSKRGERKESIRNRFPGHHTFSYAVLTINTVLLHRLHKHRKHPKY